MSGNVVEQAGDYCTGGFPSTNEVNVPVEGF